MFIPVLFRVAICHLPLPIKPSKTFQDVPNPSQVPVESAAAVTVPYSYAGALLSLLGQEPGSFSSWQFKAMSRDWPFKWLI